MRRIVAAIAAVGDNAREARANLALHVGNDLFQRMAVIGIAGQRRHMGDELPAFRAMERGGDRNFDAKLIRAMRLAFPDAFDLGRVQGIDFSAALVLALVAHPFGQPQRLTKTSRKAAFPLVLRAMSRMTRPSIVRSRRNARRARLNCLAWA